MADEKIVTSIVANSDFSNLIADLQRVTSSLHNLQQEFAGGNRALAGQIASTNAMFAETMRKTGQYSTHFVSLTSDVEKFGKSLDGGRLKLGDYFRVYQDHVRTSGGLIRDLAKQQVQLQNAVLQPLGKNAQGLMQYNVHIPRGLDLTKNKTSLLKQELQIMNKVIQDGGVQLINWGKNTQWAGRQLTVGLTLPLVAFGKAAADAFRVADQELTRLTKVYGDVAGTSAQELSRVRKEVTATSKELSAAMGVNFAETISLAADIAATGKTGNELLGSLKETTRLAVLGEVDRQEAMKATLAIQSAFKANTDELAESINFLNAVENQTSTTLNDLVEAIPKAGPVIKGLGGNIQDLALYLTAMREGGINASEGANALKSALASLINPTDVAVDKFKGFGIDLLGIVQKNAGSTTDTLFALQAALDRLNPLQKQQAIEQLFGKFQYSRLNALFENLGRQGSQTLQVLDLMKASAGELEAVAGRELTAVTESAAGRFKRAIESLKADLAGVGDQFLNIATRLINVLDKILQFGQKLPDPIKKILAFGGAFTAIIGPVIMLTGVLANFFGYIIKGLGHFKALFKGAEGFKLLTPEIMAAQHASSLLGDEFYNDAKAADTLRLAIRKLSEDLVLLQKNASGATTATSGLGQVMTTTAGSPVAVMGGPALLRQSDPTHPLIGGLGRASAHMNPRDPNNPATVFGLTFQPEPLNRVIGRTPQVLMTERLPNVEGLTSVGGRSTGVVAGEHARLMALMATLGLQSKQEIEQLKKTIKFGGQVSSDFIATFDDILPITTQLSTNAAAQSAAIVAELNAGKITVEQAKAKIIALNTQLEIMMGEAVVAYGAGRGRTIDLTKTPLIDQPIVDATGKPNVRGMFRQGIFRDVMMAAGRATRTKTYGGPYSIETTRPTLPPGFTVSPSGLILPPGYIGGGSVEPLYFTDGNVVPGPNVNADVVPAMLTPGEFVLTQGTVEREGEDAVQALHEGRATIVPVQNKNKGGRILGRKMFGGGQVSRKQFNYGTPTALTNSPYIDYSPNDLEMLDRYLDHLMSDNYDFDFKSGVILNDSIALAQSGITDPDIAIQTARNHYKRAEQLMEEGYSYRDARALILEENPRLRARTSKQGVVNNLLRKAIGDRLRSMGFLLGPNDEFLDRGHLDPRKSGRSLQTIGFYGTARMDRFNRFTNLLNQRLGFEDVIPDSSDAAKARAAALLRSLGFSSYEEYLERKPEVARIVQTGRPMPGRAVPLGLFRLLGMRKNAGGMIPGYFGGGGVTRRWGKVYGGDELSNTNPLHGPLQIGKFAGPKATRMGRRGQKILYTRPGQSSSVDAFLTGSLEDRGRYVTQEYMLGNYDVLRIPGAIEAMRAWGRKATGTFHRGINLNRSTIGPRPLPDWLTNEIKAAQASGDFSSLIGKEFIMRRSSWSSNPNIAREFGDFSITADVKNRRVTPSSEMFPEIGFVPKSAQNKSKAKKIAAARSEEESIFGGKFRIVKADKNGIQVETVAGPFGGNRRFGGQVNAGMPYVVGENGPELFVPKNAGGIIPGYNKGGKIPGVQYRFGGGMISQMILGSLGFFGGSAAGQAVGGQTGSMIGGMLGSFAPMLMMSRGMGDYSTKVSAAYDKSIISNTKLKQSLVETAMMGGKVQSMFARLVLGATKFNLVLGGLTAAVGTGYTMWRKYNDTQQISAAAFGLTAESAEKAGLKFTDYNTKIKDAIAAQKLMVDQNMMTYNSLQSAGTPFKMTIQEYKDLRKELKETMSEQIKVINATSRPDAARVAVQLKEQFMAVGMSAEEAAKKIYTLFNISNKAGMSVSVINTDAFKGIVDAQTAAASALQSFNYAKNFENTRDAASALNTALTAINNGVQDLVDNSEKAAKKKGQDFDETAARYDAEKKQLDIIASKVKNQAIIGEDVLTTIKRQVPEVGKLLRESDTVVSIFQKLRLVAMGFTGDLSELNAQQADAVYKLQIATSKAVESINKAGLLKQQYKDYNRLTSQIKDLEKASRGQSVKEQIDARERLKSLDKEINKINKKAEAKKKALREEAQAEDMALRIQQKRLEYEKFVAAGDFGSAASAQIDLQRLQNEQQITLTEQQIEERRLKDVRPFEREKEKIQNAQDKLADKAALASENLDSLSKKAETQKNKIDAVNESMAALDLALKLNADNLKEFKTTEEFKGLAGALAKAVQEAKLPGAPSEYTYVGGAQGIAKTDLGSWATDFMSKYGSEINTIVAQKGINVTATGDIIIGGKKIDMDADLSAPRKTKSGETFGAERKIVDAKTLQEAGKLAQSGRKTQTYVPATGGPGFDVFEWQGKSYAIDKQNGIIYNFDARNQVLGARAKYADGGLIKGPGTSTSDSVPILASRGEYMMSAIAVENAGGPKSMDNLHEYFKNAPRFKDGGKVGDKRSYITNWNQEKIPVMPRGVAKPGTEYAIAPEKNYPIDHVKSPMGSIQRFIDIARSQIGSGHNYKIVDKEGTEWDVDANKYTTYVNDLYKLGSDVLYWCGAFIAWASANSGVKISDSIFSAFKSSQEYKKKGMFNDLSKIENLKNVKPGDIAWFDFVKAQTPGVPDHASIVTGKTKDSIRAIGQYGTGRVAESSWKLNELFGSARPEGFANGGYINPSYFSSMSMPSYLTGVKYLPGDTIAQLHAREAVLPPDMNPWNPTARNPIGGNTYYVSPVINAAPGMDENAITDLAVTKVMAAFKQAENKIGSQRNINRRYA